MLLVKSGAFECACSTAGDSKICLASKNDAQFLAFMFFICKAAGFQSMQVPSFTDTSNLRAIRIGGYHHLGVSIYGGIVKTIHFGFSITNHPYLLGLWKPHMSLLFVNVLVLLNYGTMVIFGEFPPLPVNFFLTLGHGCWPLACVAGKLKIHNGSFLQLDHESPK